MFVLMVMATAGINTHNQSAMDCNLSLPRMSCTNAKKMAANESHRTKFNEIKRMYAQLEVCMLEKKLGNEFRFGGNEDWLQMPCNRFQTVDLGQLFLVSMNEI
jgi:hypothetical protein